MSAVNQKCQVPTPSAVVDEMLNYIDYNQNLYGKRVLENSCGEGRFLTEIVRRYISDCLDQHMNIDDIAAGLQRDIHGCEKDKKLHSECLENLNLITSKYGISVKHWDIKRKNALFALKPGKFQFVIGNPPYLAYPEMDTETRKLLRTHFESCKSGKPDYYYAFIEAALKSLSPDGKFAYLVPGNFTKNLFSQTLRQLLLPDLTQVTDYSHQKLFIGKMTSSMIIICDRTRRTDNVCYEDKVVEREWRIPKTKMQGKWNFTEDDGEAKLSGLLRFGDYFHASAPVATQRNHAFLVNDRGTVSCSTDPDSCFRIEEEVLRDAAGPGSLSRDVHEKIIFPYCYDEQGNLLHYGEEEFHASFPNAYRYLLQFKEELIKRKADTSAKWFEYGRSQLLARLRQKKIIMSTFITGSPHIYELDADTIPYAGICVTAKGDWNMQTARRILESNEFLEYVNSIGVCANGKSYRISPRDVNEFRFPSVLLEGQCEDSF